MQIDLHCPTCLEQIDLAESGSTGRLLSEFTDQGPWQALGDGQTFEDALSAALPAASEVACPACGHSVPLSEETLGQFTLECLAQW